MTDLRQPARDPVGSEITALLQSWAAGEVGAQDRLFGLVYPELHLLAAQRLAAEGTRPTLQATELVNEAYLRLVGQRVAWQSRTQFFALASILIRRILVDRAKRRLRSKRGAGALHLGLGQVAAEGPRMEIDLLALDRALTELARIQGTAARVVDLRFFAGLSLEETAATLHIGRATAVRSWRFARTWLAQRLRNPA